MLGKMIPSVSEEYLDQAIKLGQKALELAPDNFQAHLVLGGAYLKKGESDKSIKLLEKALTLNPSQSDKDSTYFYLGLAYFSNDLIDQALGYFEKFTKQNPQSADAYFYMATCYRKKDNYKTAASLYQKVISINPGYNHAYNALGSVYILLDKYQEAIVSFQKSMEINGKNTRDLYALGTCYLASKDLDKTIDYLKEIVNLTPSDEWTQLGLGIAHYSKESFEQAIDSYRQLLDKDYSTVLKYHRRAADTLVLKMSKEIITTQGKKQFELRSDKMIPYYLLCIVYRNQGDYDNAIKICKRILELDPEDNLASFLLGEFYADQTTVSQPAIDAYKRAIEQNNQDVESAIKLVKIYLEQKQYSLALVYSQKALAINPDDTGVNFQAGLVYWKKGLFYSAQPLLEKAVELDPTNLEASFYLGAVYADMKDQTAAQRAWQKVVDEDPNGEWGRKAKANLKELK